ncbi:hypothetical protein EDC94DRAFT_76390 [Helicostylum pulchrum]|nr:hypothetical protein EDC94DRAFT_76390 [Helicostylum pulchrum]
MSLKRLLEDDSDDEQQLFTNTVIGYITTPTAEKRVVSTCRQYPSRRFIPRDRISAQNTLYNNYFSDTTVYTDDMFRRRFRMRRSLFLKIVEKIRQHDAFFVQKRDVAMKLGFSAI